jgi:predicted GNAT superfamily acetyltransferase
LMRDGLNAGLPSDRFQVEWWIDSRRVRDRLAGTASRFTGFGTQTHITGRSAEGLLMPGEPMPCFDMEVIQVEIPADYQAIKGTDPGLAMEWRMVTREIFDASFSAGYVVVDFVSHQTEEGLRSFYVLCSIDWEEICA